MISVIGIGGIVVGLAFIFERGEMGRGLLDIGIGVLLLMYSKKKKGELKMAWKGFLVESKSYMGYEKRSWKKKVKFWWMYPKAYFVFHWMGGNALKGKIRRFLGVPDKV